MGLRVQDNERAEMGGAIADRSISIHDMEPS